MKIVSLNLWGGRMKERLGDFFDRYPAIDMWLFQEVYKEPLSSDLLHLNVKPDYRLFSTLSGHLNGHGGHFCQVLADKYGLATFAKEVQIVEMGEILIARGNWEGEDDLEKKDHHRKIQWMEILANGKKVLVANTHLTHRPSGKTDSEKRLRQSRMIVGFLDLFDCPKILMGDFNLLPDTESIAVIEAAGMRNLIKEFNIQSTRTELYTKPLRFADYAFVSPGIKVKEFKVLPDVVSDHAPLYLDFEV